jgi:hypothetical protein
VRITRLLVAVAIAATAMTAPADAGTPSPASCQTKIEGAVVPANPGGVAATASVIVVSAQVECHRDPLTTPPIELDDHWWGHISLDVTTDSGQSMCGHGPDTFNAVGPVLVMAFQQTCVLPVTEPARLRPLTAHLYWATLPPYQCCGIRHQPLNPVGIAP